MADNIICKNISGQQFLLLNESERIQLLKNGQIINSQIVMKITSLLVGYIFSDYQTLFDIYIYIES